MFPNTPAAAKGIQKGDYILAVDNQDTKGRSFRGLLDLLRGNPGTRVVLRIRKKNTHKISQIALTRVPLVVSVSPQQEPPAASTGTNRPDASALPARFTSEVEVGIASTNREGLVNETIWFRDDTNILMLRSLWLTRDRSKIVRTGHILYVNGKQTVSIVDMREGFEYHVTDVHSLPNGVHLTISEADAISPKLWKFDDDRENQKTLACFVRDSDGLIRPMTRSEYETVIDERIKKLSRK